MIVCTGGRGTIGQFLPESVVRLETRLEDTVEARVEELRKLREVPSAFIHLAAFTSVKEAEENPSKAFELNVKGTVKWLEAASLVGIPRFISVSTSHVFKATHEPTRLGPSSETNATSVYGRTKAEAEKAVLAHSGSTRVTIARIFSVTSAKMRDGFLYPELLRRAREKDFKPLPGHQNVRDFIDAEAAAGELLKLAASVSPPSIVHIAGETKSVRELAEDVMGEQGISPERMASMFPPATEPANYLISEKERS